MQIIPSVDIKDGKCVKLIGGKVGSGIIVSDDPVSVARFWEEGGADILHVIDLDGAISGKMENRSIIKRIIEEVGIPVEVGGGLRRMEDAIDLLETGARWVILGTAAIENPSFVHKLMRIVDPSAIIVAIDSRGEIVLRRGWSEESSKTTLEVMKEFERSNIARFLYTDVEAEGKESGINVQRIKSLVEATSVPIIYAGGISSLSDLTSLDKIGVYGVVIGSALYRGKFTLKEAKSVVEKPSS